MRKTQTVLCILCEDAAGALLDVLGCCMRRNTTILIQGHENKCFDLLAAPELDGLVNARAQILLGNAVNTM